MKNKKWWLMPAIIALERQRQEGQKFEASLSYLVRACLEGRKEEKEGREGRRQQRWKQERKEGERKGEKERGW